MLFVRTLMKPLVATSVRSKSRGAYVLHAVVVSATRTRLYSPVGLYLKRTSSGRTRKLVSLVPVRRYYSLRVFYRACSNGALLRLLL